MPAPVVMPRQGGDLAHDIENEEDDVACKDAWSTGNPNVRADDAAAAIPASVEELKQIATRSLQAGDYSAAVTGYTAAIAAANNQQLDSDTLAKLHSNRAHAHICNQKFQEVELPSQSTAASVSCTPLGGSIAVGAMQRPVTVACSRAHDYLCIPPGEGGRTARGLPCPRLAQAPA